MVVFCCKFNSIFQNTCQTSCSFFSGWWTAVRTEQMSAPAKPSEPPAKPSYSCDVGHTSCAPVCDGSEAGLTVTLQFLSEEIENTNKNLNLRNKYKYQRELFKKND